MKTAMQELIERLDKTEKQLDKENNLIMSSALYAAKRMALEGLDKEKEQVIAAVRYGQNNYKENVYEEGELYYNEIYNSDAPFIKSSIPNGNIKLTKTNNL